MSYIIHASMYWVCGTEAPRVPVSTAGSCAWITNTCEERLEEHDKELELVLKKPEDSQPWCQVPESISHDLWGHEQKQKPGFTAGAESEWEPFLLNSETKTSGRQQGCSWQEVSLKANWENLLDIKPQ